MPLIPPPHSPLNVDFWTTHRVFFLALAASWLAALLLLAVTPVGNEIWWFNARHTPFLDEVFKLVTQLGEGPAYLALLLLLLGARRYRAAATAVLLGLAVVLASGISKQFFAHPRPFLHFSEQGLAERLHVIEGVTLHGGLTSFPSGHTLSAFAFYTFFALNFPTRRWVQLLALSLAIGVGISRMYLLNHFLKDVVMGAWMGVALAVLFRELQTRIFGRLAGYEKAGQM